MRDLLIVGVVIGFFALASVFVAACDRIIGAGSEDRGR